MGQTDILRRIHILYLTMNLMVMVQYVRHYARFQTMQMILVQNFTKRKWRLHQLKICRLLQKSMLMIQYPTRSTSLLLLWAKSPKSPPWTVTASQPHGRRWMTDCRMPAHLMLEKFLLWNKLVSLNMVTVSQICRKCMILSILG